MQQSFMKTRPILPLVLSMSLPMVLSMMVSSLYNIVDSYYVAKISEDAMTALSLVYPVQNLINAVTIGFSIGANAVISYHLGAGEGEKAALGNSVHGLVMATKTLGDYEPFQWFVDASGNCSRDETEIGIEDYVGSDSYNTFELVDDDIEGYETNRLIREKRAADFEAGYYPVFKAAYESSSATLMNHTTGWYLPSNGQWFDILRGLAKGSVDENNLVPEGNEDFYWMQLGLLSTNINNILEPVKEHSEFIGSGMMFWTSSVASPSETRFISLDNNGFSCCYRYYKMEYMNVLCVLGF